MEASGTQAARRGGLARLGELALKVLSFFVILEPIWMLLPFAGFLYGSVLQIETLGRHSATAWLTHFVFPVLTGGWLGPALVVLGFVLFAIGAAQIYGAKLRKTGLVTRGLYRFVRHPQYIALTLFGLGILLTWGRAITFLAFFAMMFLYYYLAKSEERACIRIFGEAYERYRERTSFIVPGDRLLRPLVARVPRLGLPAPLRVAVAFVAAMALCLGLMWLIVAVKESHLHVPYLTATVAFDAPEGAVPVPDAAAGEAGGVPFVQAGRLAVARGPYRNAQAPGFAERLLARLSQSEKLKGFLGFLGQPDGDAAIVFCGPFEQPSEKGTPGKAAGTRGPAPDPHGPDRVRLVIMHCALRGGASIADALADKARREIRGGCIALADLGRPEDEDIVVGEPTVAGPRFPGEERWDWFVGQFKAQAGAGRPDHTALAPGRAPSATLVLVQAPILRTRLDPAFAEAIRDRLAASPAFRKRLRDSGAGGNAIAVAFPRPGPNWYREHHRKPQVSLFVVIARLPEGAELDALFHGKERELAGAFTAEMDFALEPPADSVTGFAAIGRRRDLEERWRFFLSGLGGGGMHVHAF